MKRFFLIIFILFYCSINSQTSKDILVASQYFRKADSLFLNQKFDNSIKNFEKALFIYKKIKNWERVVACHNKIAENQLKTIEYEKALLNAKKALDISVKHMLKNNIQEAYAYDNIGSYYRLNSSNFETALEYYKKAQAIRLANFPNNYADIAISHFNIGTIKHTKGLYKDALDHFNKALSIRDKMKSKEHIEEADIYEAIGHVYYDQGLYDQALNKFENTLSIASTIFKENNRYFSKVFNKIGIIYFFKREFNKSLEYYKKALNVSIHSFGKNHPDQARLHYNIGTIYYEQKLNDKALFHVKKTLEMGIKAFGENHRDLTYPYSFIGRIYRKEKGIFYINKALSICLNAYGEHHLQTAYLNMYLADLYHEMEDYENELKHIEKALVTRLKIFGKNNVGVVESYNSLAKLFLAKQEYKIALKYIEKAILANTNPNTDITPKDTLKFSKYLNHTILLSSLEIKATLFKKLYWYKKDINYLKKSNNIYEKANQLIYILRQNQHNLEDKIVFSKNAKNIYEGGIETQLLFNSIEKNQKSLEKAFNYAEKSKWGTLIELLNEVNAKNFSGLPSKILELEKNLKLDKAYYQSKISKEITKSIVDTSNISSFESEILDIARKQDSLTKVLEKHYPKYYQLKYKNDLISVADIQKNLNKTTTLVEFFISDSIRYVFVITKNKLNVTKLSTPKLNTLIKEFRESITLKNTYKYKIAAHQLYNELIAPIKNVLIGNELIIIPDEALWHLNFDLLLTNDNEATNFKDLPYLLKEYAISYANSANLLFSKLSNNLNEDNLLNECIAFSFSNNNHSEGNTVTLEVLRNTENDLPGTREEINAIAEIIDGKYFFGSNAIEANFKNNVTQYSIVHLALHGEIDNKNPKNSKIYFTQSKDTIEDNLLYSHELYALDIPAELVVLSACNTGAGTIAKGEGILSLGTAFQYAGTKSLLLSGWEVPDKTTPLLMKKFYTNLYNGMNKSKALQQAKLQYLNSADQFNSHPYYWGGFYIIGDRTPIQFQKPSSLVWNIGYLFLGIFVFAGLFYFYKKHH